jgi:predicted Zn-dependent protease
MNTRTILTAASMALIGMTALAETYKDPRQRFELEIPAGWTAEAFGEGVKVARGGAYFLVMDGSGESAESTVGRLVSQFGSQWSKFMVLKQGNATVNGQAAPFSFNSGVNPKGVPSFLKVAVVSAQGRSFALVGSAPQGDFINLKPGFDQIEQSFRIRALRSAAPAQKPALQPAATKSGGIVRRRVIQGGKESAAQVKALGRIFRKL